jgi:hypothetical protein
MNVFCGDNLYKNPLSPLMCFSKPDTPVPDWEKDPIHNPVKATELKI